MRARRDGLTAGFLLFATAIACARRDAPEPPPAAAWVGADTLTAEQLAHLLVLAQPFPLDTGEVVDLVRHWQAAAVLARFPERRVAAAHAAANEAAADSAVARMRTARLGDADSVANANAAVEFARGELRLIAHVLRRADAAARPEEHEVQRRTAETILGELRAGADWTTANRRNEDAAAAANGGVIGVVARGELPAPLDSIAFALPPGGLSEVVRSAAGYHILYRPPLENVRLTFTDGIAARTAAALEARLGAEVATRRDASLAPIAALRVRELTLDPWAALGSTDGVGSFDGGSLTGGSIAGDLARLSWNARRALRDAPAADREAFAGRALVRAALRAEAADSGFVVDPAPLRAPIEAGLESLARHFPADTARARIALDRYMGRIAARHLPFTMLAPASWRALLLELDAGVRVSGIGAAIERARVLLDAGGYRREGK